MKEIKDKGIKIDSKEQLIREEILRVPGTINSKSAYICRILSEQEVRNINAKEIIKNTKHIDDIALLIPKTGNDVMVSPPDCKILGLNRLRARSNPPYYYTSFLSNKVVSTKMYIPIIDFKQTKEEKVIKQLKKVWKHTN